MSETDTPNTPNNPDTDINPVPDTDIKKNDIPVNIEEMKHIADEGLKMPPKSTYIEPKLRSGVTIYEF